MKVIEIENREKHRRSIRIKEYDYSKEGMYFVTICTQNREEILSKIVGAGLASAQKEEIDMYLTKWGEVVNKEILNLSCEFDIRIDNYIIMPNHIHMIIEIYNSNRAGTRPAPTL